MLQLETGILDLAQPSVLLDSGCRRSHTAVMRHQAVQRAILTMQERYMDHLMLQEIADAAQLSPFHFDRVFRSMIGVSPSVFLAAIRMREAKKLLLMTKNSITSICFDVGYTSLGTFTSRFTFLVGLAPSRFRLFAQEKILQTGPDDLRHMVDGIRRMRAHHHAGEGIHGVVHSSVPFSGLTFVGLFSSPLPQGPPVGCCVMNSTGRYSIAPVPDGEYYLFSAAMDESQDLFSVLAQGPYLHGGRETPSVLVRHGRAVEEREIVLTPPIWADPPIVVAFPWLFMQEFSQQSNLAAQLG
jgi:AraC-like DNA-binding protein